MKCEIKNFEDFMEKYSAEEAEKHLLKCRECKDKYGRIVSELYPSITMPNLKIRKKRFYAPFFRWSVAAAALVLLLTVVIIPFISQSRQKGNMYSMLNYEDYLDITSTMDEDEVVNMLHSIQEEL